MMRLDDKADETYIKAAVYGPGGTGKTTFATSAPKPLILLSERQGVLHIRQAAMRAGRPMPAVLLMQNAEDYRRVLVALRGDRTGPLMIKDDQGKLLQQFDEWPETVVIDSLTDACRLFVNEIRVQSPPKPGKDGLPVDSTRFWGVLGDRALQLILAFRNLPFHVLFLCTMDDRTTGEGSAEERTVRPAMPMRRMADELCAAVNVMAVTFRTQDPKTKQPVFGIRTQGPDWMLLKPHYPLRAVECSDYSDWVARINGEKPPTLDPLVGPVDMRESAAQAIETLEAIANNTEGSEASSNG
jgi:hypothetical protein